MAINYARADTVPALRSHLKSGDTVLFAGAGVSAAAPASVPLFRPLRRAIQTALEESVARLIVEQIKDKPAPARLSEPVPEVLFQALHDVLREDFFGLLRTQLVSPDFNDQHRLFVDMLGRELKLLITTNFDTCFEQAAAAIDKRVVVCPDAATIKSSMAQLAHRDTSPCCIWKPHGTMAPGFESTIQTTLKQVALNRYSSDIAGSLIQAFSGSAVLVVGYSGYDYDLAPALGEAARSGKELFWLAQEPPAARDPASAVLAAWDDKAHLIVGDIWDLCRELAHGRCEWAQSPPPHDLSRSVTRSRDLHNLFDRMKSYTRLLTLGALYNSLDEHAKSVSVLQMAEAMAGIANDTDNVIMAVMMAAEASLILAQPKQVSEYIEKMKYLASIKGSAELLRHAELVALRFESDQSAGKFNLHGMRDAFEMTRTAQDSEIVLKENEALLLSHQATSASKSGNWQEAEQAQGKIADHARKSGNRQSMITAQYELGIIHYENGRYDEARRVFDEVIQEARSLGLLRSECVATYERGMIAHRVDKDYGLAKECYVRSEELASSLGLAQEQINARKILADLVVELGVATRNHALIKSGTEMYDQVLDFALAGGFEKEVAYVLLYRAHAKMTLGDAEGAQGDLERADEIARPLQLSALLEEINRLRRLGLSSA